MLTLNTPGPDGLVTTTFANAEKLVALGANIPAAAMVSGQGALLGEVLNITLRRASSAIDANHFASDANGVESAVESIVGELYERALAQFKLDLAAQWSQPGQIELVNKSRTDRGLPEVVTIGPERIKIIDDPAGPANSQDWDVEAEYGLTIVVASFFVDPRAVAIAWPGARRTVCVPGAPLWWWGSGGSSVARLIRGFDAGLAQRLAANGDVDAQHIVRITTTRGDYAMPTPISAMPLQDAVEFAEFLGQVSCGYDRFTAGPPSVGGCLDVMVLRQGERQWIQQKRIHSSLNYG